MTKILVVDDDPLIVEGLVEMLRIEAFDAAGALDRETAEEALAAEFYPVVLADLRLRSEEEGWRLLDAIARISPSTRVASMTGYATDEIEQKLRERGAALVLRKPMEITEIVALIREMAAALETAQSDDLDEVYRQTYQQLAGLARKRYGIGADEAQDILHEAWCLFLEKRASVRTPKAWLSGTVVNLCRRWIEERIRWRGPDVDDLERWTGGDVVTSLVARDALERVDARTRRLCELIAVEGLRYDEVSDTMRIPIGSVGPLYMRAKKKMRDVLTSS
jgi:DNA-directed RNA polymerase specialized sigma24 family protein